MKKFIAYFDFLGYKQFLESNSESQLKIRAGHILRDIEMSLSDGEIKESSSGIGLADLENTRINCLNISDTVIFWTIDDTIEDCKALIKVAYRFNWQENFYNFPVRGCLIYDDFNFVTGNRTNAKGAIYRPNLMYGKGLLNAHLKSDNLNWAGTVIDNSLVERIRSETNFAQFIEEYAKEYQVPYKGFYKKEFAIQLGKPIIDNSEALKNRKNQILDVFEMDNKSITPSVQEKIDNTIKFLESNLKIE